MKTGKGFIFKMLPALVLAVLMQSVFGATAFGGGPALIREGVGLTGTVVSDYSTQSFTTVVGSPQTLSFTIDNTTANGSIAALGITDVQFTSGAVFSTNLTVQTITTDSSKTFTITYTPLAPTATGPPAVPDGDFMAIGSDDDTTPNFTIVLSGTATAPLNPTIAATGGISPTSGTTAGGTTVTITGTNFYSGLTTVTIGGAACTGVTVAVGGLSLTCTTPAGTVGPPAVDVVVTNTGSATLATAFTYTNAAPTASVAVFSGTIKEGVLLTSGTYTYSDADSDSEGSSSFQWYTGTDSSCAGKAVISGQSGTIASGATKTYTPVTGDVGKYICFGVTPVASVGTTPGTEVVVTTASAVVAAAGTPSTPTVTAINPPNGTTAGGTPVTITGTNFLTGLTSVTIGGALCSGVAVGSTTSLTCTTPAGTAGAQNVVVTVTGAASTGTLTGGFTYIAPPPITASVVLNSVSNITGSTALATATAIGSGIGERGFYWWIPPTAENHFGGSESGLIPEGYGAGNFSLTVTGLKPGNTYRLKAYVKVGGQTITSDEQLFTTPTTGATGKTSPTVLTDTKNFTVSGNSITVSGEITDVGTSPVNVYGFVYAKHTAPFIGENMPETGDTAFAMWEQTPLYQGLKFTGTVKNIPPGNWYLRTYAHNANPDSDAAQTASLSYGEEISFSVACTPETCIPGDVNGDGKVDLNDAMLVLRILDGIPVGNINLNADVNGDGKIGLEELGYILQKVAELRPSGA